MNIWCKCLANETDWYVTSIINRTRENNCMHNRKILMLFWGVDIRCLVSLSTMRKTYTNFWVTWQQIQKQWLYFTFHPWLYAQITMHHFWLTRTRAVAIQALFFENITSKCTQDCLNGPIHVNSNILKFIAASALEAETRGCFVELKCQTPDENGIQVPLGTRSRNGIIQPSWLCPKATE